MSNGCWMIEKWKVYNILNAAIEECHTVRLCDRWANLNSTFFFLSLSVFCTATKELWWFEKIGSIQWSLENELSNRVRGQREKI